jgi:hypothetical protein
MLLMRDQSAEYASRASLNPCLYLMRAVIALLSLIGPWAMAQDTAWIRGDVTDSSGTPVYGAVVMIQGPNGTQNPTVTDTDGAFQIHSLQAGDYTVRISAKGFTDWTASDVRASAEPESRVHAVLQLAPQVTSVTVALPVEEVAAAQISREVQQRALGVIPNFYVTYENHPAPLSSKQKTRLALKLLFDPISFAAAGMTAGIQQANNSYWEWGQGAEGFAKRFGAAYATGAQDLLITSVVASSLLHQDPRYFYSGRGTTGQRVLYAFKSAFLTKGDNGTWQPPYASLIGDVASAEISNTYYPGSRTQYTLLGRSLMFHFAGSMGMNLAQEFFIKKLTSHTPKNQSAADRLLVLREGTRVPLIAVDWYANGLREGQTVTFVLAEDLMVSGKVLMKAGGVASGQVGEVAEADPSSGSRSIKLERVTLRAGNVNVPLRSNQIRGIASPTQHRELPQSGKVEVTLFVAEDTRFPGDE